MQKHLYILTGEEVEKCEAGKMIYAGVNSLVLVGFGSL